MTRSERRRLETVLPFYVNGSANAEDRAFVDALHHDREAGAMLAWHRGLAEHVQADVESASESIGWAALTAKVRAQRQTELAGPSGWRAWLALERWLPRPIQTPAFAVLALMVVAQAALLSDRFANTDPDYSATRGAAPVATEGTGAALLRVNFKDETPERDLRLLLISVGASIVRGPGQLGDYTVSVATDHADAALHELERSDWVVSVRRAGPAAPSR